MAQAKFKAQLIVDRLEPRKAMLEKRLEAVRIRLNQRREQRIIEAENLLEEYRKKRDARLHELRTKEHGFFTGPLSAPEAEAKVKREMSEECRAIDDPKMFIAEHARGLSFASDPGDRPYRPRQSVDDDVYEAIQESLWELENILFIARQALVFGSDPVTLSGSEVKIVFGDGEDKAK